MNAIANSAVTRPNASPGAFTVNEAAGYLRISRASIYKLFASGELSKTRIGGRVLVRRIDADALLERSVEARASA